MDRKRGERTLLVSVLLSVPGPILLFAGLTRGRASTQIADFVRRLVELFALAVSYVFFRKTQQPNGLDLERIIRLERISAACVGAAMCVSGLTTGLITLLYLPGQGGSVAIGLSVAILGAATNFWFYLRYSRLNRASPNRILDAQRRLYRAKTIVDVCISVTLAAVTFRPDIEAVRWLDIAGTIVVSGYMLTGGIRTICTAAAKDTRIFDRIPKM